MLGAYDELKTQQTEYTSEYYNDSSHTESEKKELSTIVGSADMMVEDTSGKLVNEYYNTGANPPENGVDMDSINQSYNTHTGFFRTESGGSLHQLIIKSGVNNFTIAKSDVYTVKFSWEFVGFQEVGRSVSSSPYFSYNNGTYRCGSTANYGDNPENNTENCVIYIVYTGSGIASGLTGRYHMRNVSSNTSAGSVNKYFTISASTSIPTYSTVTLNTINGIIGGWGSIVELPSGSVAPARPWDYFNNIYLPWVRGKCSALGVDITKIIPFSDGYTPPVDPTEPGQAPTIPVSTVPYNPFYEIATETHTEIVEVTNDSGEVIGTEIEVNVEGVTDAEGADEYQYEFKIPELPHFKIPDIQIPTDFNIGENLANVCGGIWDCIYNFLSESGFLAVVIPALTIGLLLFILRYLGG